MSKIVGVTVGTPLSLDRIKREIDPSIKKHEDKKDNPHAVTKDQVGLGNVDNTSDMNKPVSTAQAEAINAVKNAAIGAANSAQTAAEKAQTAANNAQTAAENAEKNAKDYADSKRYPTSVMLNADSWTSASGEAPYFQRVSVVGVTEDITLTDVYAAPNPSEENYSAYLESGIRLYAQHDNEVEFLCADKPEMDIEVNLVVHFNSAVPVSMFGLLKLTDGLDSPIMCSLDGEDYGVGNATVNGVPTTENYDFTVL